MKSPVRFMARGLAEAIGDEKALLIFTLPWRGRVDANEMNGGVG
jgi:hypothetical protein